MAFLAFPAHVTPLRSFHQRRCRSTCGNRCMRLPGAGILSHALSFPWPLLGVVGTRRCFVVIQRALRDIRSLKSFHVMSLGTVKSLSVGSENSLTLLTEEGGT